MSKKYSFTFFLNRHVICDGKNYLCALKLDDCLSFDKSDFQCHSLSFDVDYCDECFFCHEFKNKKESLYE